MDQQPGNDEVYERMATAEKLHSPVQFMSQFLPAGVTTANQLPTSTRNSGPGRLHLKFFLRG